jgi:hypothetical protein
MEPYWIATQWNQNYIIINDWSQVDKSPIEFGDYILNTGDKIIKIGTNKRSAHEMKVGFYLEYKGCIDGWLIFDCNYPVPDEPGDVHFYFSFIRVDRYTLLKQTNSGQGFADIKISEVIFYKI